MITLKYMKIYIGLFVCLLFLTSCSQNHKRFNESEIRQLDSLKAFFHFYKSKSNETGYYEAKYFESKKGRELVCLITENGLPFVSCLYRDEYKHLFHRNLIIKNSQIGFQFPKVSAYPNKLFHSYLKFISFNRLYTDVSESKQILELLSGSIVNPRIIFLSEKGKLYKVAFNKNDRIAFTRSSQLAELLSNN